MCKIIVMPLKSTTSAFENMKEAFQSSKSSSSRDSAAKKKQLDKSTMDYIKSLKLPNINTYFVSPGNTDWLAQTFGISRKMERSIISESLGYNKGNAFLQRNFRKLAIYAKNKELKKFMSLAEIMLKNSVALRCLCLFRVEKTWYKSIKINSLQKQMRRLNSLLNKLHKGEAHYEFKRVFIEKPDGSLRPIASPPLFWRIAANMLYTISWLWFSHSWPSWQHGARPQKGVNSCWKSLWRLLKNPKSNYIYEFDLRKFFDSVDHKALKEALSNLGGLDETTTKFFVNPIKDLKSNLSEEAKVLEWQAIAKDLKPGPDSPNKDKDPHAWARACKTQEQAKRGVPQGYSMSPLLACYTLARQKYRFWPKDQKHAHILMYMDDGLIISERDPKPLITALHKAAEAAGTVIHPSKSKMLKENGSWLVDSFKFLGLEYLPNADKGQAGDRCLKSKTRNGTEKLFPICDLEKLIRRGPYYQKYVDAIRGHGTIEFAMRMNFFDSTIANLWTPKESLTGIKLTDQKTFMFHPMSFIGFYLENTEVTKHVTEKNASSIASRALVDYIEQWSQTRSGYSMKRINYIHVTLKNKEKDLNYFRTTLERISRCDVPVRNDRNYTPIPVDVDKGLMKIKMLESLKHEKKLRSLGLGPLFESIKGDINNRLVVDPTTNYTSW